MMRKVRPSMRVRKEPSGSAAQMADQHLGSGVAHRGEEAAAVEGPVGEQ